MWKLRFIELVMVKNIAKIITSPKVFVYTLAWLMVLVLFGTIAQKDIGLYASQMKYFSSYFFMFLSFIPLPGGRLVLIIMTINLFASFFKNYLWKVKKIGIIIVHIGGLMLLFGGGLTALFSSEGNMVIEEGDEANYVDDYHEMELVFANTSLEDSIEYTVFDSPILNDGSRIKHPINNLEIYVISHIKNVRIERRISPADSIYKGLLKEFVLLPRKLEKENEQNRPAIIYKLTGADQNDDGVYGLFLGQGLKDTLKINGDEYYAEFRRKRTYLPFEIELLDFKKVMHPGTNVAKSYSSEINLIENEIPRRSIIKMNEPLRHKGYTFYQASFVDDREKETTVLAAVKNYGRLFPYISSIVMSIGLLMHLLINLPILIKKRK